MKTNFSRYTVNALGTLASRVKEKVLAFVSPVTQPFIEACDSYNQSLNRGVLQADQVSESDTRRDMILRGMLRVVEGYTFAPDEAAAQAAQKAQAIIDRLGGFNMARLGFKEETTAINRAVEELKQLSAEEQGLIHLDYWLPVLSSQNNQFETELSTYVSEQVDFKKTESATLSRKQLEMTMHALFDYIESINIVAPTEETQQLQSELTEILNR